MRITSTIIAVLLAALSVFAMWRHGRSDLAGMVALQGGPRPLLSAGDLPMDAVDRVTLRRAAGEAVTFERRGAEWRQTQPFAFPMDAFSIRQMIAAARELIEVDRLAPESLGQDQTLATLHLAPADAEVTYQWPGGSLTLELGRRSVAGRAYLRRKGDDLVYIVNQRLHERAIDMNPWEWRQRRIFQLAGADSSRIGMTQGEAKMTLEREGRNWRMLEPAATRVDSVNRDAYLQALGRATVAGFVLDVKDPEELASFGLTEPIAILEVATPARSGSSGTASERLERLLVGSRTGTASNDRFGMIEGYPVVVRLSEAVLGALFRSATNLADPTGSGVNPADVKSIAIRTAAVGPDATSEFRLERDLEKWRAPQHGNAEVPAARVQELLDQLCRLRAPMIELREYPRELEIAVITLHGFDGRAIDTVRIAQERDKPATALENGDNVLRVFPQGLKLRLQPSDFGL